LGPLAARFRLVLTHFIFMPQTNNLPTGASTVAFTVPPYAKGFLVWSEQAVPLRVRWNADASASGADMGFLLPPASSTDVKGFSRHFVEPPSGETSVEIFHAGGSTITSGVGYEIYTR
jgi:hypothetical protein